MQYRPLGHTGIQISAFGPGSVVRGTRGAVGIDECKRLVSRALHEGVNLVGAAEVLGGVDNEMLVGRALVALCDGCGNVADLNGPGREQYPP
ncbi:MAG: hypothetical protein P8Q52_03020, partial [Acidimicrobiales bacterium]|nr:hypothetical protein [Acidimicrobiales bacterium]